jgi:MFS transporter, SET family, sugar efflux transporter
LLNPVLALLLVALFDATPGDVGWVLAVYNAGGFLASLVIPGWADRSGDYLRPLLICAVLTVALAGVLSLTTSLPVAVIALIVLGGPAGVGSTLLFAELKHSGAGISEVMNTRAVVSFAWVAGPPLATFIMGSLGDTSILTVLAAVGVLNIVTTGLMVVSRRSETTARNEPPADPLETQPTGVNIIAVITVAFILLQATNSAVMSMMTLFVTVEVGLPVTWGGIILGVAAMLEIPALWLIGRCSQRFSVHALTYSGCLAGLLYYAGLIFARDPVTLLALQPLNAWFFGVVAGIGLTLFQQVIPRPGLATGLFMNTRRIGAIVSGPIIAVTSVEALGYPGLFALCAVLTAIALFVLIAGHQMSRLEKSRPTIKAQVRGGSKEPA